MKDERLKNSILKILNGLSFCTSLCSEATLCSLWSILFKRFFTTEYKDSRLKIQDL